MSVTSLYTGREISAINHDAVEMLEMLLARVKSGQVVAVAYAAANADGTCAIGLQEGGASLQLTTPIMALFHDYASNIMGES